MAAEEVELAFDEVLAVILEELLDGVEPEPPPL